MEDAIIKLIVYLAPMYVANSSAMVFGGKTPIDFGKTFFDGKPIFGKGKTFKGVIFGLLAGTLVAYIISIAFPKTTMLLSPDYLLLGFFLSLGAIIGDMVASFFKRRNELQEGKEVLFLDQLDFVIGGMFFGSVLYIPEFYEILAVGLLTLVAHRLSNYVAFKMKLKKVPW